MRLQIITALLLVALATASANPAPSGSLGRYVSDCNTGDACLLDDNQPGENDTVTSIDGTLYCCSSGNSITVSVSRRSPGYNHTQATSFVSSDDVTGVFYTSDLSASGSADGNNQVVCECREIDLSEVQDQWDAVQERLNELRARFWQRMDDTWNRLCELFQ